MRIRFKRWFWRFLGLFGVLLVGTTIYAGYQWHFAFSPYRKMYNYEWCHNHSEVAYWHAMENAMEHSIKKGHLPHEAGCYVSTWGDEEWTRRLIEGIESGKLEFDTCEDGHIDGALRVLTNQDIPNEIDIWVAWWKENKDKTQEEWIRDGFEDIDITVTDELTDGLTIELLIVLGSSNNEDDEESPYSGANQFNAYRWLRDHRFRWRDFEYDDLPDENPEVVFHGLGQYASYHERYPKEEPVFDSEAGIDSDFTKACGNFGIPIVFCFSVLLFGFSRGRLKKLKASQTITPDSEAT